MVETEVNCPVRKEEHVHVLRFYFRNEVHRSHFLTNNNNNNGNNNHINIHSKHNHHNKSVWENLQLLVCRCEDFGVFLSWVFF